MSFARRIAVLLLVALWLPVAMHCRLEAAGLLFGTDCCEATHSDAASKSDDHCDDDACGIAEGVFTNPSSASLSAPAPVLCACLMCAEVILPPDAVSPPPVAGIGEAAAAPPELERTWAFTARAALSPRAP